MNRPEYTHTAMKFRAVRARTGTCLATATRKRSKGNTAKMVSDINHFCGFVNTELRIYSSIYSCHSMQKFFYPSFYGSVELRCVRNNNTSLS
jgi:hypothetical protein